MADAGPVFDQVNVVVKDMGAALAFYRRLGLAIPDPFEFPGSGARHAEVAMPNGTRLEFDNHAMVAIWHPGWRAGGAASRVVVNFSFPSRAAVDECYAKLTSNGAPGRQAPHDAFWGARFAIVADPDGNYVGLMSPMDPAKRFMPAAK